MHLFASLISCSAFLPGHIFAQAQVNPDDCQNPAGVNPISPACWTALAISQHVTDWWATYNTTCRSGTLFAQCFLQILNMGTEDCLHITSGTCPPPSWTEFQSQKISVKDYYIAYSIYAVWSFFNSYYTAIGEARSLAITSIGAIVALLDPPKKTNVLLNDLLTVLAAGLPFLAPIGDAGHLVGAIITAAQQAPGVAKYLFPTGTLDSQFAQVASISNSMGVVTQYLQSNVSQALAAIQNDPTTFLAVTGAGSFSINPLPTIPQQSEAILKALNTYVISQCLQANNWMIGRAIDTDMNELEANKSANWKIAGCGGGYDSNMLCGAYYWNKGINVSFTLTNNADLSLNPTSPMQQIFANWTTPALLFDGAAQCQAQGGSAPVNKVGGSGVGISCLSNLKVCTWDLNPSHFGTEFEFVDCPTQRNFAVDGCKGCFDDGSLCVNVPYSYVGEYLVGGSRGGLAYYYCNSGGNILPAP